jgi:outer membrane protein assembly factor BamD
LIIVMKLPRFVAILVIGITVLTVGCASTRDEDQILAELANQEKEAIFEIAEDLYEKKNFEEARKYFSFVYDTFPNDPLGHKAALRVADTYAAKKDTTSLTEARLRYRDFASRYPNDPDRDYSLLMVGHTYTARKLKPDRDLSSLLEAVNAYQQLLTLYPNSSYAEESEARLVKVREVLAEHEWIVASFYTRNKRWLGAKWRLEYLKENYPEYKNMDRVNAELDRVQSKLSEREEEIKKLMEEAQQKAAEQRKESS